MQDSLLERITIDPELCHGAPCVRGLRMPVEVILDLFAAGMSEQEILDDYPYLEADDLRAAFAYAARLSRVKSIHRVA